MLGQCENYVRHSPQMGKMKNVIGSNITQLEYWQWKAARAHIYFRHSALFAHIFIQIHIKIERMATALRRKTCQPTEHSFWAYYYTAICTQWESGSLFSLNREREPSPSIRERRGRVSLEASQEAQWEVLVLAGCADVEELATPADSNQLWNNGHLHYVSYRKIVTFAIKIWKKTVSHSETIYYNLTALD